MSVQKNLIQLQKKIPQEVTLVAVSKTKPIAMIEALYKVGQRVFGENKVQELTMKHESLPQDIQWHMIGHLQRNKVKYIAPFVALIHAVDTAKLLGEVSKQAVKNKRTINCLLQLKIAQEDAKYGLTEEELLDIVNQLDNFPNINIVGLMGMATFTNDVARVSTEFTKLKMLFDRLKKTSFSNKLDFTVLSMGMSADYEIAIAAGSTMVRVGSAIFGMRNY